MNASPIQEARIPASGARFGIVVALIPGLFNILVTSQAHKFREIFSDAFPSAPLPFVTLFIFHSQTFLICTAIVFAVMALLVPFVVHNKRNVWTIISVILGVIFAQIFITGISFFYPLWENSGTITGMR
jgi:hypothetical protein